MKKLLLPVLLSIHVMVNAQCFVQVSATDISCNGLCNGSATATPVGVPNYSYLWQPGGMTTQNVSGLCPGTYTVTVVDGASCSSSATVTITEPAALSATATHTNATCGGGCDGTATAFVTGGTSPYSHSWSTNPGQTNATATNLCAGTYNDTITDSRGCVALLSQPVTIGEPPTLVASVICSGVSCFGGSNGMAIASQAGGTPGYTYSWSTIPVQTNDTINNLPPGTYSCTITDTVGCVSTAFCTVNQPASALAVNVSANDASCSTCCDGSLMANPSGGTASYTYMWSPGGQTTQGISNLCPGNYTVCVTDNNGCVECASGSINFNSGISSFNLAGTRLYPNPTAGDIFLEMLNPEAGDVKISIINMVGREIFSEKVAGQSLVKKKISVRDMEDGVYFLKIRTERKATIQKFVKNSE